METTSTASNESFEYAKSEIAKEILRLKNRLDYIIELNNSITEKSDTDTINYLLHLTNINVKWSKYLMNDIKALSASIGK